MGGYNIVQPLRRRSKKTMSYELRYTTTKKLFLDDQSCDDPRLRMKFIKEVNVQCLAKTKNVRTMNIF